MEADGATDDDIQVFAENTKVDKSLLNYPEWIKVVIILSVLASFVLLVWIKLITLSKSSLLKLGTSM
jgi:hypothetical protein